MPGHSIRKAVIELEGGSGGDAFAFRQQAEAWVKERVLPALEKVFASLPESEEAVCIDRLEITLDARFGGSWNEPDLARFEEELQALVAGRSPGRINPALQVQGEVRLSAPEAFYRRLEHYLRHGIFPWASVPVSMEEFEADLPAWLEVAPASFRERVANVFSLPQARLRMLRTFTPASLRGMAAAFFGLPPTTWDAWEREVAEVHAAASHSPTLSLPSPPSLETLLSVWRRAILEVLASRSFAYGESLDAGIADVFFRRLAEEGIGAAMLSTVRFRTPGFSSAQRKLASGTRPGLGEVKSMPAAGEPDRMKVPAGQSPRQADADRSDPVHPASGDGIYVANAGLVLVAPFLSMLFNRIGLAEAGVITNPGPALVCLHYLATGNDHAEEFQLALAKVFCGLAIEDSVELPAALPGKAKAEADELLASVIEHWSVLKNTSVNGLREGFLQRPGKLAFTPGGEWLLQMEQRAYDMVLQHVPWNYGMVRLPWMKNLLRAEWAN